MAQAPLIQRLDHVTIRTRKPEETVRFFTEAIGLTEGWRPGFRFPGHWLYAGDIAVLHIVTITENEAELRDHLSTRGDGFGSGAVDHLSFRCHGLNAIQQRLLALQQPFRERVVPDIGQHQLFLRDPNGITVELVFSCEEGNEMRGEETAPPAMTKIS